MNFDADQRLGSLPTGFAVTPTIGRTLVSGITIQSANDAPERDPKTVVLEGSNDAAITGYSSGTWQVISTISVPAFGTRFQTQTFLFDNFTPYRHYRWTVTEVQTPNDCCMQVAEVEFLAVTEQVPCAIADFTREPTDTPALDGASATFTAKVNGPWPLQWMVNGTNIPGATALTYTTPPVTAANTSNQFTVAIVGCQTSQVFRAVLFAPSTTKSVALSFRGGGANGAPSYLLPTDIAGVHQQAYWNNMTGTISATIAEPVQDSDNALSTVTLEFDSTDEWGSGTGTENGDRKMLNGYLDPRNDNDTSINAAHVIFHNVPAGTHSLLVYTVNRPLAFHNGDYTVTNSEGVTFPTLHTRVQNADEYNADPRYVRGTSTNPAARAVANFIRFDNIVLTAPGDIGLTAQSLQELGEVPRGTAPVNGIQLLINPPAAGQPPVISSQPASRNIIPGSTATFNVTATGTAPLTYQWRKNGVNLSDGGNISGANTSTLTINNVASGDAGTYTVVVANSAGSVTSSSAVLSTFSGAITDRLIGYWQFNETSGLTASNSVAGGVSGELLNFPTDNSQWVTGKVGRALKYDGTDDFVTVSNFTKPTVAVSASAWVWQDTGLPATGASIIANPGTLTQQNVPLSPFDLGLSAQGDLRALITSGPANYVAREGAANLLPEGSWQHVAFVADGVKLALYRNGTNVGSVEYSGSLTTPTADCLGIGGYLDRATCNTMAVGRLPWIGILDDVALWNRPLGPDEILAIYNVGQQGQPLTSIPPQVGQPRLSVPTRAPNGDVTFTWTGTGRLQQASTLTTNAFSDVTPPPTGNTYTVNPASIM